MKVRSSVKKICDKCKCIKRKGRIAVIAKILNTNKDKDSSKCGTYALNQ